MKEQRKRHQWLRGAAALIAGGWVIGLMPLPSALAGTLPSTDAPPTSGGWVEVSTAAQLEYIDQNQGSYWSSNIELMNNLDLTGYSGWVPFGNIDNLFTGTFNGQGHEITGLAITDNSDTDIGFFGYSSGTIENVGLDATVTSSNKNGEVAALVGTLSVGEISNSYATGSVSSSGKYSDTGGLVGYQVGGTISDSYATPSVSGSGEYSNNGGLVGEQTASSSVSDSYATGLVSGTGEYSYNGGLVGYEANGSVTNSYFDATTTNQTDSIAYPASTTGAESTTWMQTPSNFGTLNWGPNWIFVSGDYPFLGWISMPTTPTNVLPGTKVTITGTVSASVYSGEVSVSVSGIGITLSDNAGGTWLHTSVTTDTNGNFTDTWTAPSSATTATLTASVDSTSIKTQSTIQVQAFTVTYKGNGNSGGTVPTDSNTYTSDSSATVLDNTGNLTQTGYTFAGWNTKADGSGTSYAAGSTLTMPASDVTLYAQWTKTPYTVSYNGNGSTGGTAPTDSNTYTIDSSATVLDDTGSLAKTGYTFAGWNTAADGSGTSYAAGSTLTMPASDVTLYAQWRVKPSITTSTLPNVLEGTSYNQQLQGGGGVSPYTYTVTSGSLPQGLTLQSDGRLVGIPQQGGTFTFTVQIKDNEATTTTKNLSLYVIPVAPTGYLKSVSTSQVFDNGGGTLTANSNDTTATLVIAPSTFTNPLQMDITTGTLPQSLVPSGWTMVAAYGVNFDINDSPSHPLVFTLLNADITPQSKVYKIVDGKLVPVSATVTKGKTVVTFTTDPDFVVLQPKPVPQATQPVTGFPTLPWAAGGLVSILTGGLALWWQRRKRNLE